MLRRGYSQSSQREVPGLVGRQRPRNSLTWNRRAVRKFWSGLRICCWVLGRLHLLSSLSLRLVFQMGDRLVTDTKERAHTAQQLLDAETGLGQIGWCVFTLTNSNAEVAPFLLSVYRRSESEGRNSLGYYPVSGSKGAMDLLVKEASG